MAKKTKLPDFEQALEELEAVVERLEHGEISLEESLRDFERGIQLTRTCQAALKDAEQKVQILLDKGLDSQPVPFNNAEPDDHDASSV